MSALGVLVLLVAALLLAHTTRRCARQTTEVLRDLAASLQHPDPSDHTPEDVQPHR